MAIAKHPKRKPDTEAQAAAFIAKAGAPQPEPAPEPETRENRRPVLIRIPPNILARIEEGAKRLGLTRSAFIVNATAEKLERMDE